jgi:type IV pilus assembly protein PilV
MKKRSMDNFRKISAGTTLIEVMVSVLILSIGLLGIAAMQATALRNTQSSVERTQAVVQTYAVMDSMRANLTQARANAYNTATWMCTAPAGADLVNSDKARWVTSMKATINNEACGRIACLNNSCTVDVRWNDSRGSADGTDLTNRTVTTVGTL